jgi:hypothetical protein
MNGSASLGANDLELYAFGCPAHKLGIFIYGTDATQVPLGNGYRCIASPFYRLGATTSDEFGDASLLVDFTRHPANAGPGAIRIGSTQRFQLWFRDPPAGGGADEPVGRTDRRRLPLADGFGSRARRAPFGAYPDCRPRLRRADWPGLRPVRTQSGPTVRRAACSRPGSFRRRRQRIRWAGIGR